jgi:hypothetical protein
MTLREARRELGRERDGRAAHAERLRHPLPHERLVVAPRAERQRVTEQPRAQVRVLVLGTDVALQLERRQELIQPVDGIVGVGVLGVRGAEVVGHARQARGVRRQIDQRDDATAPRGHLHRGG